MTHPTRRRILFTMGAIPLVLAGCGGGDGGANTEGGGLTEVSFAAKAMVDNLADNVVVQTCKTLNTAAAAFLVSVQALKAQPSEAAMDAAQAAWRSTRKPWEAGEGFLFGPADSLGIDPAIDSWPLNTPDLNAYLAAHPAVTQADIEAASDDLRGFHAMEYLLFGDGVADNDKAAAELTAAEANCLVALAQAFKARTQALEAAWTTDFAGNGAYVAQLKAPGTGRLYTGHAAVVEEFINGLAGIADEVGNTKLAGPLGTSADDSDASLEESQYSWNTLADCHDNLQSVLNVYTGKLGFSWASDTAGVGLNGLYAFVSAHDAGLAQRVLDEITSAQKAIALIKGDGDNTTAVISGAAKPLRIQIRNAEGRTLIESAIAACDKLRASLQGSVRPLVGKTTFV